MLHPGRGHIHSQGAEPLDDLQTGPSWGDVALQGDGVVNRGEPPGEVAEAVFVGDGDGDEGRGGPRRLQAQEDSRIIGDTAVHGVS